MLKYLFLGFFVKIIAGLDDTITHIPVLASITQKKLGRIAFGTGVFLAIIIGIGLALGFATSIKNMPYARYISAGLIFLLAVLIYFDVFVHKPREEAEKKVLKPKKISAARFTTLIGAGMIAGLATVLDDIVVFAPLFLRGFNLTIFAIVGILIATILEIMVLIYFSKKIVNLKYKEEIASAGLVLLGILTLTGTI